MRVLVENFDSKRFYAYNGDWVPDRKAAHDFKNTEEAMRFCVNNRVATAQILLVFGGNAKDIILPVPSRMPDMKWRGLLSAALKLSTETALLVA